MKKSIVNLPIFVSLAILVIKHLMITPLNATT